MSDESKDTPEVPDKPEQAGQQSSETASAAADTSTETATPIEPKPAPPAAVKPEADALATKPLEPLTTEKAAETKAETVEAKAETPTPVKTDTPTAAAKPETPTTEAATMEAAKPETPAAESPKPAPPKAVPPKAPTAAAGAHKPAPPPVKKGPAVTEEIKDDPFIDKLKAKFGEAITEAVKTFGQRIVRVKKESYLELCNFLVEDEDGAFDMCADLTALHWPDKTGEEFDIVVNLYSVSKNVRLRVKTAIADGEAAPSVTPIWQGANWMEREVFDMFGVKFDGHPDLRRILLPEDWPGFPLRKEYPIEYRDNEWTDKHIDYLEVDYDTSLIDVKYAQRR
jgi:NADH-quinone oxidoreductase subunit C